MHYDTIIIGAGPAGLSCALHLARHGVKTLVVERNSILGAKACAGGITWSGLISQVPSELIERSFPVQHIFSKFQQFFISENNPIIATINRITLGQYMAGECKKNGVHFHKGTTLVDITENDVTLLNRQSKEVQRYSYSTLVGADGSSSRVRQYLGLSTHKVGLGINYVVPRRYDTMEWHINNSLFGNGYGWVFPHRDVTSVGAYIGANVMPPKQLHSNLRYWARERKFPLTDCICQAGKISYDYQGWKFDRIYLAGDAAGLASPLTGEGIYPAMVSGEMIARHIINNVEDTSRFDIMIARQKKFLRFLSITSKNPFLTLLLGEFGSFALRTGLLKFTHLEMAQ